MDTNSVKIIAAVLLFLDTVLFGWPPYFLVNTKKDNSEKYNRIRKQVISYLNCFAGGIFLGASLLHLWPEGYEKVQDYFKQTDTTFEFPVFEAVVAAGFFLIGLVEQLAHKLLDATAGGHHGADDVELVKSAERQASNHRIMSKKESYGSTPKKGKYKVTQLSSDIPTTDSSASDTANEQSVDEMEKPEGEIAQALKNSEGNPFRALMLLVAISSHSIFDGLAVGLTSGTANIWQIFGAICIHKSLVSLCLGTELFLVYKDKPYKAFLAISIFGLIAPAGIGIGMALTSGNVNDLARTLTNGILEGIATGTFLYVTFFEILRVELVERGGVLRLLLAVLGFGGMAAARLLESHEDEHGSGLGSE